MNGEKEEEEESEGIPAVNRLVLSLHFMVVHPPPQEGLTDYLSLPFQMHLRICVYYLPVDKVSLQLILILFCVTESQMEPESAGKIYLSAIYFSTGVRLGSISSNHFFQQLCPKKRPFANTSYLYFIISLTCE